MQGFLGITFAITPTAPDLRDFTVDPNPTSVVIAETTIITVTAIGGLDVAKLTVSSSNSAIVTSVLNAEIITVTGVGVGSTTITVGSTEIEKVITVEVTVAPVSNKIKAEGFNHSKQNKHKF